MAEDERTTAVEEAVDGAQAVEEAVDGTKENSEASESDKRYEAMQKGNPNSWVVMAMNPTRQEKLREGKDPKWIVYRNVFIGIACLLMIVAVVFSMAR